jgi:hypothetical protein
MAALDDKLFERRCKTLVGAMETFVLVKTIEVPHGVINSVFRGFIRENGLFSGIQHTLLLLLLFFKSFNNKEQGGLAR